VDSDRDLSAPVDPASFSTTGVHTSNGLSNANMAPFPHMHTAYELRKVFLQI